MHQQYADRGLVCMSVAVDEPSEMEAVERARTFLVQQKATFANYLMDEPTEVWQNRWDANGPPVIFVFDRQGKRAAKYGVGGIEPYKYEDIEKLVVELLERKP